MHQVQRQMHTQKSNNFQLLIVERVARSIRYDDWTVNPFSSITQVANCFRQLVVNRRKWILQLIELIGYMHAQSNSVERRKSDGCCLVGGLGFSVCT
jgi:hypothetical protein